MMPMTLEDVLEARRRIRPYLVPTPLRSYAALDEAVGHGVRVFVKHENHNPTNAFKARNGLSAMTMLGPDERRRGVVAATRGNHGQALAWAGAMLGVPVTICVPKGNSPLKNKAVRGFGATLVEEGRDYDEAVTVAQRYVHDHGMTPIHSTNNRHVIAGAGTVTLEMLEDAPELDAIVYAVGGGSLAVGGLAVLERIKPRMRVFAVQAKGAAATCDSWKTGRPVERATADTFADGLATRRSYEMTFDALREGLEDFITVTDDEMADGIRLLLRTTSNLAEGAGAAGLAGLRLLADRLVGQRVGVIVSGGNLDEDVLARILAGESPLQAPASGVAATRLA